MLVGGGLGFLYAPCAGPILAGVITVSASQSFTAGRLGVALAYGIGSAVVLYALMLGAYIAYIVRTLRIGPERDHPQWDAEAQADDGALVPGVNRAVLANGNVRV